MKIEIGDIYLTADKTKVYAKVLEVWPIGTDRSFDGSQDTSGRALYSKTINPFVSFGETLFSPDWLQEKITKQSHPELFL